MFHQTQVSSFIDVVSNPVWMGVTYKRDMTATRDNGKTWSKLPCEVLFGSYFFLSTEVVNHKRSVYSIVNLLGSIGGLASGLFVSLRVIVQYVNNQQIMGKFIRNLYFIELPKEKTFKIFGTRMTVSSVK